MTKQQTTVLIVEDEPLLRNAYQAKLEHEGFRVFLAENGKVGLELLQNVYPDIILLDMIMPEMNGLDFLEIMKEKKLDAVPVIVLSNLDDDGNAKKVKKLGVKEFLIKSNITIQDIPDKIKKHLPKKHS
ncbi:MAG: response regulator [Patescibacteria group bacterium]